VQGVRNGGLAGVRGACTNVPRPQTLSSAKAGDPVLRGVSDETERPRRTGYPACAGYDGLCEATGYASASHNSRALENANDDTRRVFSSRIKVRVIGGSARWLQFSRSQSLQLTPIGVPSVFSRSMPAA
jgi:hypothetical protein